MNKKCDCETVIQFDDQDLYDFYDFKHLRP